MDYGMVSLVPIVLCFALIFISKNAFVSVLSGILTAVALIWVGEGRFVLVESVVDVCSSSSTTKTVLFILLVGALIKGTEASDGVAGLMGYLEKKQLNIQSPVLVQLFAMAMGVLLFVDATSSMVVTSVVGKPLFQKARLSREKLALITNSTAAPIAWLVPFGGAGALMAGLISTVDGIEGDAFGYVLQAVPFQCYTITLLLFLVMTVVGRFEIGPLRHYQWVEESFAQEEQTQEAPQKGRARNMAVPLLLLLGSIFAILFVTGDGNFFAGDGASAVFYGGLATLGVTLVFYSVQKLAPPREILGWYYQGGKCMFTVTLLLAVALVFSDLLSKIGTAVYLVGIFDVMPPELLPLVALLLSSVIAFSTGTSGGTVAIVTGLLLPMAVMGAVPIPLVLGAIVSGSVFGDQSSIISDSVILTSSVTGVDPITHVKTQLPYTLVALAVSAVFYLIFGFIM